MSYNIRKSKPSDLDTILRLREEARQTMIRTGNKNQWTAGHPAADVFVNDIKQGNSYLIEDTDCNGQPTPVATLHRDNHIMQHLLAKHGFSQCGIIHLLNGDERLAYQKVKLL